jgi:hypothetical protein
MTAEMIEKFLDTKTKLGATVQIHFKERKIVSGIFIKDKDYDDLKTKNFWRVVSSAFIEEWNQTKSADLVRLFNGNVFTKLSEAK